MRNILLTISYDGTDFSGWQRQTSPPTIQGCVETALARIVGGRVTLYGSGRTDAGVHALNQFANFTTACRIPCASLVEALNNLLSPAVRVRKAEEVPEWFHARYNVKSKTYRYRILMAPVALPFLTRYVWHYPHSLEIQAMATAAGIVEGEHDFTSFAASGGAEEDGARKTAETSMVRTIFSSRIFWRSKTSILVYEVKGSGFLHHMVRNIVGTLIEVGRGRIRPDTVHEILAARDRTRAGPTAPASGLTLISVEY